MYKLAAGNIVWTWIAYDPSCILFVKMFTVLHCLFVLFVDMYTVHIHTFFCVLQPARYMSGIQICFAFLIPNVEYIDFGVGNLIL